MKDKDGKYWWEKGEIHWEELKGIIQKKSDTTLNPILQEKMEKERKLLQVIQERKNEIMSLHEKGKRVRDDGVYRYYHHSAKVYFGMQEYTEELVTFFKSLISWDEKLQLNDNFMQIIGAGTGKAFKREFNFRWEEETRTIVEAFFHAFHILEMMIEYGFDKTEPSAGIEAGWATVLYLYHLR